MTEFSHATMAARVVEADGFAGLRADAPLSIRLLKSPAYRCMTRSAHLVLAKIVIERASGRFAITHAQFAAYGVSRDGVAHAVAELEALGIVVVERRTAHANAYDLSQRWRSIGTIAEAVAIRDRARHFGLTRRRKVERETARRVRAQRLAQLKAMIDAPLDALDDAALSILRVIADAIGRSKGVSGASVSYEAICDATGVHRNTVAASLRTLRDLGLIDVRHGGRRASNVYRISDGWRGAQPRPDRVSVGAAP